MPSRSQRPCGRTGCCNLSSERYCQDCSKDRTLTQAYDFRRGSSSQRGYGDASWRKIRLVALKRDGYLCVACMQQGQRPTPATDIDHIIPVASAPHLRLVLSNLQSLCHQHHSQKTATENGGFGNKRRKP